MTNLSELLPSGGGAKEFEAVASGNIATGQTIILKSNGQIEAVGETQLSQGFGSTVTYDSGGFPQGVAIAYDTNVDRICVVYYLGGSYPLAQVGTVSGSSITFGTATTVMTQTSGASDCCFDASQNKIIVVSYDNGTTKGLSAVGTISSGTNNISFGSTSQIYNQQTNYIRCAYDEVNQGVVAVFRDANSFGRGYFGTTSGTTTSWAGTTTYSTSNPIDNDIVYSPDDQCFCVIAREIGTSRFTAYHCTVSSGNLQFGSGTQIAQGSGYYNYLKVCYNSTEQKFVAVCHDSAASGYGDAYVGTVSGTSINWGGANRFATYQVSWNGVQFDPSANKLLFIWRDDTDTYTYYSVGTQSGNSITYTTRTRLATSSYRYNAIEYDPDTQQLIYAYQNNANGNGAAAMFQNAKTLTNNTDFIGITSEAIANTATGKVNPQGGVATSSTVSSATTFGAAAVFANNGAADTIRSTYDSNSNRIVVAYTDSGNSAKGTASVGTVSGDTISWGPQALFLDAYAGHNSITFDSSNNKVVIAYVDAANQGYAVVGTVDPSNNTITFGSATQFESGNTQMTSTVFDSSNNKVVIAYQDDADSDKGKAVVGVVSGTAITFPGSIAQFSPGSTSSLGATFDSTNNKVVVFFRNGNDSNHGYGVVGEVSGNNISFGSATEFWGYDCLVERQGPTFDSTNNKVVLGYRDLGNTGYGYAVAGTVSGNAITFGTPQAFNSVTSIEVNSLFDPSANKIVFSYHNNYASGEIDTASLSGTVFTFDTGAQFSSSGAYYNPLAYDSTAQKVVVAYRDAGNSNYGTAKVINLLGATETFTIGSTYYVQNDGTITTTSSTVTAGKAISTTQLVLKGAS